VIASGVITSFEGVFNLGVGCCAHVADLEWASFSVGMFDAIRDGDVGKQLKPHGEHTSGPTSE
jgi:hypothetical protein